MLGSVSFSEEELPGCIMFEQNALDLMLAAHVASLAISPLKHPPRVQDDDQPPQAPTTTPECTPLPRKRKVPDSRVLDQHAGSPSRNREQPPSSVVEPDNTTKEEEEEEDLYVRMTPVREFEAWIHHTLFLPTPSRGLLAGHDRSI